MKLISMTDFVLDLQETESRVKGTLDSVIKYANFLKQPLKLEMFVPSIDNEPFNYSKHGNKKEFEQAKEKVLFEGFEVCNRTTKIDCVVYNEDHITLKLLKDKTIEYLINRNLTLTPNAIKQILS
jgi:hypothetical protein